MKIKRGRSLTFMLLFFSILFSSQISRAAERFELRDSVLVVKAGVKQIPSYAFRDREDIAEVRFESPCYLGTIGDYAFLGCVNLRKVVLPNSLHTLGEGAFRECSSLEKISIPAGVKKLPPFLFYFCVNLRETSLPSALTVIGRSAFGYCRSLTSIRLPSGVKNIGSNAFSCCESLEEVSVPSSVVELESYAFSDCRGLKRITFPRNGALLGELILSGCENLETIVELNPVPPKFDCDSFLFEPDETERYERVLLRVAPGREDAYSRAAGWRLFRNIED